MRTDTYADQALYDADRELEELYAAITGRPAFSYSQQNDPLYRGLADSAMQNGRRAMRDTLGRASALTGGYASSYAQSAGQQQYDSYLRSLSEALPELYSLAWQRYSAEGDALRDRYDRARGLRDEAYKRSRDALSDERYAAEQEVAAGEREAQRQQTLYKQRQDSYKKLYSLIESTGYEPTDAELEEAGISRAQAEALRYEFQRRNGMLPKPYDPGPVRYGSSRKKTETRTAAGGLGAAASLLVGTLAGLAGTLGRGMASKSTKGTGGATR